MVSSSLSSCLVVLALGFLAAAACSGQPQDRPSQGETASAAVVPAGGVHTGPAPTDTFSTAPASSDTGQATASVAPQPQRIKPSIDPGRKTKPSAPPSATQGTTPTPATSPASSAAPSAAQASGLKYDAASNTVTFDLIGGPNGFQFNGYASGGGTLTLPPKANVVMNFVNKDGTPHSAEIISGEGPIPTAAGDPAIPRAYTNQALQGLPQEGSDVMRFQVPDQGSYRIFCGVPGHGLSGMWIWMKVDPAAKTPSFGPTKS
jgi:hypothetical protein